MGICTTTTDMRGMGSRHGQPGMRNETVAAALAAAASLVIRRTSGQILQSRCTCLWGARRRLCPCRTPASRGVALCTVRTCYLVGIARAYQEAVS